jgi:TetR/AcrR family transcriptional regulator
LRKKRDGENTRKMVIEAAGELFAEKGFSGTSITSISQKCGISEGLILYHFKSKNQLYDEVLSAVSKRYAGILIKVYQTQLSPREMLARAVDAVFDFWQNDTIYQRINLWAWLEKKTGSAEAERMLTAGMTEYLEGLKQQGELSADFDPVVFLSMIIGPIQFWARYKLQFAETLGLNSDMTELDSRFLNGFKAQLLSLFR